MWLILAATYVVGLAVTARVVLAGEMLGQGHAISAGCIALWPFYWGSILISVLVNRK